MDQSFLKLAAKHKLPILPMLDNVDNMAFKWERLRLLLSDKTKQLSMANELKSYLLKNYFACINIDFEPPYQDIPDAEKTDAAQLIHDQMPAFINTIKQVFHPVHLIVTQDLPPSGNNFDYGKLADANDFVIVMLYDQHVPSGVPGPIASQIWLEQTAENLFSKMDSQKVVLGIANYCYDWQVKLDAQGNIKLDEYGQMISSTVGEKLLMGAALKKCSDAGENITMDDGDLNPWFSYMDSSNKAHLVYMLDAVTAYNEIMGLKGYEPGGVALWYLGSEDPSIWKYLNPHKLGEHIKPEALESVKYASTLNTDPEGNRELIKIIAKPSLGKRVIKMNEDGIITSEHYTKYPSPYIVRNFGSLKKAVALTFDDGPDPNYTPQVLDILKNNNRNCTCKRLSGFANHSCGRWLN